MSVQSTTSSVPDSGQPSPTPAGAEATALQATASESSWLDSWDSNYTISVIGIVVALVAILLRHMWSRRGFRVLQRQAEFSEPGLILSPARMRRPKGGRENQATGYVVACEVAQKGEEPVVVDRAKLYVGESVIPDVTLIFYKGNSKSRSHMVLGKGESGEVVIFSERASFPGRLEMLVKTGRMEIFLAGRDEPYRMTIEPLRPNDAEEG